MPSREVKRNNQSWLQSRRLIGVNNTLLTSCLSSHDAPTEAVFTLITATAAPRLQHAQGSGHVCTCDRWARLHHVLLRDMWKGETGRINGHVHLSCQHGLNKSPGSSSRLGFKGYSAWLLVTCVKKLLTLKTVLNVHVSAQMNEIFNVDTNH